MNSEFKNLKFYIKFTIFFSLSQGRRFGLLSGAKPPGQSKLMKGIGNIFLLLLTLKDAGGGPK